jgi:hypothetical protein
MSAKRHFDEWTFKKMDIVANEKYICTIKKKKANL